MPCVGRVYIQDFVRTSPTIGQSEGQSHWCSRQTTGRCDKATAELGDEGLVSSSVVKGGEGEGGDNASQPSHIHRSTSNVLVDDSAEACPPSQLLKAGAPENTQKIHTLVQLVHKCQCHNALLANKALNYPLALPLLKPPKKQLRALVRTQQGSYSYYTGEGLLVGL